MFPRRRPVEDLLETIPHVFIGAVIVGYCNGGADGGWDLIRCDWGGTGNRVVVATSCRIFARVDASCG